MTVSRSKHQRKHFSCFAECITCITSRSYPLPRSVFFIEPCLPPRPKAMTHWHLSMLSGHSSAPLPSSETSSPRNIPCTSPPRGAITCLCPMHVPGLIVVKPLSTSRCVRACVVCLCYLLLSLSLTLAPPPPLPPGIDRRHRPLQSASHLAGHQT